MCYVNKKKKKENKKKGETVGMGNCWCKNSTEDSEVYCDNNHVVNDNTILSNNCNDNNGLCEINQSNFKFPTSVDIDKYVLETLSVIGALVDK